MSKKLDTIKLELGVDPQVILEKIDYIAKNCNTTYSDAILHYCKTSNTEIEVVAELIKSSPKMKNLLQLEYESVNMLPKTSRLPI